LCEQNAICGKLYFFASIWRKVLLKVNEYCRKLDDYTPSISTCEYWFRCYKKGDFDGRQETSRPVEKIWRSGRKFEEVEASLNQDSNQKQEEFAKSLNINRSTISRRLKVFWPKQWNLSYAWLKKLCFRHVLNCLKHARSMFLIF